MTPEQYVKQFYPDAFCEYSERYKAFAVAIEMEGEQVIIGKSEFFERIAWQNAKASLAHKHEGINEKEGEA